MTRSLCCTEEEKNTETDDSADDSEDDLPRVDTKKQGLALMGSNEKWNGGTITLGEVSCADVMLLVKARVSLKLVVISTT